MDFNQPPMIRIYQSCQTLISIKRKMFSLLKIDNLPHSPHNEQKRTISTQAYLYIKKIVKQVSFLLADFSLGQTGQNHIDLVDKAITNLKNHNEYLSQQEKLILQAHKMIQNWNKTQDPVIYYEQRERNQLKKNLKGKLQEINTYSVACKQTKKPLYIRKLERQLKQNLYVISENERKYNTYQFGLSVSVRKKIIKLLGKLLDSLTKRERSSFVDIDKNMLLSTYIDIFYGNDGKVTQKDVKAYRKDLLKTVKSISNYFQEQKLCFQGLLSFLKSLESLYKQFNSAILKEEDSIIESISEVSGDINYIVNFEQALQIINSMKSYFITSEELNQFKKRIPHLQKMLDNTVAQITEFSKNILKRQFKSKNTQIAQFIEDKKFLQSLSKRQDSFQITLFESLGLFLEKTYRNKGLIDHKPLEKEDLRKFRYEKAVQNIFENYFAEIQNEGKSTNGRSTINSEIYKLSLNQQKQMDDIQNFINNLTVFDGEVDWKDSYQCSLGPRLLIHGKMKVTPEGLIYHSSFNKRNYFFGRTKIFIPKQEIFEINQESVFVVFDDVIEVVTKKGRIYFHALGKREKMITQLNENFFPEVNNAQVNTQQLQFNEFKQNQEVLLNRIKPFMSNLEYMIGEGDIPNINLRTYFHRYQSQQEFQYQGKIYDFFKLYTIEIAGGTNVQGAKFSPGIPYYMKLKGTSTSTQDIHESERFFTYKKQVPMIPFVSKGGHGICQQKCVFRWGGPKCYVYQIFTTLSGFSLTEGMLVKARIILEEKKNSLHYTMSGQVTFETNSATNNMLRGPALSNLKSFILSTYQLMKKVQKTRKVRKGGRKSIEEYDESQYESKISQLSSQNTKLKKIIVRSAIVALLLYIVTIVILIY